MRCYLCGKGELRRKRVDQKVYGQSIGMFPAEVCDHCHEVFFDEETSKRMTAITKRKGLFGLEARTKIGQAGSTLDIRLPKKIIEFLNIKKGEEVTIVPEGKERLVVYLQ